MYLVHICTGSLLAATKLLWCWFDTLVWICIRRIFFTGLYFLHIYKIVGIYYVILFFFYLLRMLTHCLCIAEWFFRLLLWFCRHHWSVLSKNLSNKDFIFITKLGCSSCWSFYTARFEFSTFNGVLPWCFLREKQNRFNPNQFWAVTFATHILPDQIKLAV